MLFWTNLDPGPNLIKNTDPDFFEIQIQIQPKYPDTDMIKTTVSDQNTRILIRPKHPNLDPQPCIAQSLSRAAGKLFLFSISWIEELTT